MRCTFISGETFPNEYSVNGGMRYSIKKKKIVLWPNYFENCCILLL